MRISFSANFDAILYYGQEDKMPNFMRITISIVRHGEKMEKTIDVMVIGTEPPCPRCDLLSLRVAEAAAHSSDMRLRHCSFDSSEATELGQRLSRKVGTARQVARDAGIQMDWDGVYGLITRQKAQAKPDCRPADSWTPELDRMLEPCQKAAESVGYLMTPVLVINGDVKHHGSVPSRQQIAEWLSE